MSNTARDWVKIQDLHETPKRVLMELADRADNKTLECWPSQSTTAKDLGICRQTVNAAIGYLKEQGFITCESRYRPNGSRTTDLVTLLMESVQTVVQTTRFYVEYLEEAKPRMYAYRPAHRQGGVVVIDRGVSMASTPRTISKNPQEELVVAVEEVVVEEVGSSTPRVREGSLSRKTEESFESMKRIQIVVAERADDDGEWLIQVGMEALSEYQDDQDFLRRLADILETGLEAGLGREQLEEMLNVHWEERVPWPLIFDVYEKQIVRMRQESIRAVP